LKLFPLVCGFIDDVMSLVAEAFDKFL